MNNEPTPGELAYDIYRVMRGGVALDGAVLPAWADLDADERAHWETQAKRKRKK